MTSAAIIVAAGRGTRAGGEVPKQWQMLAGKPVLAHAVAAFEGAVDRVLLVLHPDDARAGRALVAAKPTGWRAARRAMRRSATRFEALAGSGVTRVLIHDGARPLVSARADRADAGGAGEPRRRGPGACR